MDGWTKVEPTSDGQQKAWSTKDWEKNKTLQGVLTGVRENVGPNQSKIWTIEEPDGNRIDIWGTAVLDIRLADIPQGSEVKIEYFGSEKNPATGRTYKKFEVWRRS